ncbi:hypothetical protein SUGI_1165920 [Cryptomeria japonica]|nr:hypothetical protein SUGI_1165920 [Cryptomeria japonica]
MAAMKREDRKGLDNRKLLNQNHVKEEVKEVLIVGNMKESKKEGRVVQEEALNRGSNQERMVSMKEALKETCWSLVLLANVVFKYVFASMRNLERKVKNETLKMMRDGARIAPKERIEDEKERRQVVAVCHEDTKQQFAAEGHREEYENKDEVDEEIYQHDKEHFEDSLDYHNALEDGVDAGQDVYEVGELESPEVNGGSKLEQQVQKKRDVADEEILKVEKLIRSENKNEGESRWQSIAEVSSSERVDFDHKCETKCVDMLVKEENRKEFPNLGWDHGYRVPHWQRKPVGERQQLKCKEKGDYVGVYANKEAHKMEGMIEFKGKREHKARCEEKKHKEDATRQKEDHGFWRTSEQ